VYLHPRVILLRDSYVEGPLARPSDRVRDVKQEEARPRESVPRARTWEHGVWGGWVVDSRRAEVEGKEMQYREGGGGGGERDAEP
jgi:hypothetical protein